MFSDSPKAPVAVFLLLLTGALATSGCGYNCREDARAGTPTFEFANEGYSFAGEPLLFSAHVSRVLSCSTTGEGELRIEVLDPEGRSVLVEEAPVRSREGNHELFRNDARFSPPAPGEYTLIARLIEGDAVQLEHTEGRTIFAHAEAPPMPLRVFESRECLVVHATEGTWICDGEVFREDVAQQTLPGFLATTATTAWAVGSNELERLVDTGTGPLVSTAVLTREHETVVAAHALDDELSVLTSRALHHYRYANGVLSEVDRYAFTSTFHPRALLRTGDALAVAGDKSSTASVCTFTLGDTLTPGTCADLGTTFLAGTERGIWVGVATLITTQREPSWVGSTGYRELEYLTLGTDGVIASRKLALPKDFSGRGRPGAFWIDSPLHQLMLVPKELEGRIVFETFAPAVARVGGGGGPFLLGYEEVIQRTTVFAQP